MSEYPAEVFDMYPEQAGAAVGFIQPFGLGEIVRNDCIEYIFNKEDGMMDSAITVKDMSGAEAFASAAMTIAAKHKGCIGFSLGKQENHVKCMFLDEVALPVTQQTDFDVMSCVDILRRRRGVGEQWGIHGSITMQLTLVFPSQQTDHTYV